MNRISIIGLGPGHKKYILPKALETLEKAEIIVGAKRHLESLELKDKQIFLLDGNYKEAMKFLADNQQQKIIAVVVSGDTGFYSLLNYIKKYFAQQQLDVIPGISCIQYMFAKIAMSWEDASLISLHGREADFITSVRNNNKVAILTDNKFTPQKIAEMLLENSINSKVIYVRENLSYDNEKITKGTARDIIKRDNYDISVVVITDE